MSIDPAQLSAGERYDLLTSTVRPRPIAWISSIGPDGAVGLAPYSFFMPGGANPMSVGFAPILGLKGEEKQTLQNCRLTKEFVVNLVSRDLTPAMHQTASGSAQERLAAWESVETEPSERVAPPRIAGSPVQMECKVFSIVEHGSGPGAGRYVIGEVVCVHVDEALWRDGKLVEEALGLVGVATRGDYLDLSSPEVFPMRDQAGSKERP